MNLDLTAPTPDSFLGIFHSNDPVTKSQQNYIVEGYLRHGLVVFHIIPYPGGETVEATFIFPLAPRLDLPAYGSGYHMTEADFTDVALSSAILCDTEEQIDSRLISANHSPSLGNILDTEKNFILDNKWWNNHRVKIFPRIYPQISPTYASVGAIDGDWLFRYMLIYEETPQPSNLIMSIRKAGARYLITPSETETPCRFTQPNILGSTEWMAEMRALQPECMSGRWWGLPKKSRRRKFEEYESMGVLSTEGTLLLNVDVNSRGLFGIFSARPGGAPRVLGIIAGVRFISDTPYLDYAIEHQFNAARMHANKASI